MPHHLPRNSRRQYAKYNVLHDTREFVTLGQTRLPKEIRASSRYSWFYIWPMNVESPEISFVIPCYNEEGNLRDLVKAIRAAVEPLNISHEIVITDDCSRDKSWDI